MLRNKIIRRGIIVIALSLFAIVPTANAESRIESTVIGGQRIVYGICFDANLKESLEKLSKSSALDIVIKENLEKVKIDDTILYGRSPEDALETILVGTGYWYKIAEGSYLIMPKEEIIKGMSQKEIKAMELRISKIEKEKEEGIAELEKRKDIEILKKDAEIRKLKERLVMIRASQEMVKEEKGYPTKGFAMYLTGLGPEYKEFNLGGKVEFNLIPTDVRIVIEGTTIEREKPMIGFLSVMLMPFHKIISPYIGLGMGTVDENKNARYQIFAGVEINDNFFVEVKYINGKEINLTIADVYSVVGFKIPF